MSSHYQISASNDFGLDIKIYAALNMVILNKTLIKYGYVNMCETVLVFKHTTHMHVCTYT